jgi:16S rRNA (uracil1498-N3)-methyltransferase
MFVDRPLAVGDELALGHAESRTLYASFGLRAGDAFDLFDDRTGEYRARMGEIAAGLASARIEERLAPREELPDLWLCLSPIERESLALVAEKACELGVPRLVPIEMRRTAIRRINATRLKACMIRVAEQCGRTALPEVAPVTPLEALLADWPAERTLFFCDERGGTPADAAMRAYPGLAAILVGPEAGFDDAENAAIRALPQAVPIALGPRILRADTAAIAAIALWLAAVGDWRD